MSDLEELLESAQPNPLLRRVDALCDARDWDALVDLAHRCRQAVERGKQLWPIAEHIDYRLALHAPGDRAASVLTPEAGRFALGPLTEVAAMHHTFEEVAPFITTPQVLGYFAAERVIHGEDLRDLSAPGIDILELPLVVLPWEPRYATAVYKSDDAAFPEPQVKLGPAINAGDEDAARLDEAGLERAMLELVTPWIEGMHGSADCVVVEGSARSAVALLAPEAKLNPIGLDDAMAVMAWAGASGGAHGRRRGAAMGRFSAWWAAAHLADLEWPPDPAHLAEDAAALQWFLWTTPAASSGWTLHIAVESARDGWAVALAATDRDE